MICPHCNIEIGTTYEPYEYRCQKCGYWFDTYTGKEVTFAPPADEDDYDSDWNGESPEVEYCEYCSGSGYLEEMLGDCPHCDGEGYKWWL